MLHNHPQKRFFAILRRTPIKLNHLYIRKIKLYKKYKSAPALLYPGHQYRRYPEKNHRDLKSKQAIINKLTNEVAPVLN
ncbi:hypothetical protein K661_02456 [Piscirickettsia salmonis LF-89 = ATCC VR-1361]|nr:hypothetical protein K661_02456 [Piscirickettsia salmonis LF-89 = ATCC VR-1361]